MADLTDQQVRDEWLKYYGPNEGADTAKRSFYDYIPAIYGSAPSYFEGLLGAPETKALQGRATLAGLLGTAGALAQGMSSVGPRRSAAQNILSALGAGFGTAGQTYQGGLENYVTQQKINQMKLQQAQMVQKQNAITEMLKDPAFANDPVMKAWALNNTDDALKWYVKRRGMSEFMAKETQPAPQVPQPESPEQTKYKQDLETYGQNIAQYKDQISQMLGIPAEGGIAVSPQATPTQVPTTELPAGTVEISPVPEAFTGKYSANLPEAPVAPTAPAAQPQPAPAPQQSALAKQIAQDDLLAKYWSSPEGDDPVKAKEYQAIASNLRDQQRQQEIVVNPAATLANVHPSLQNRVATLNERAKGMKPDQIVNEQNDILKDDAKIKEELSQDIFNNKLKLAAAQGGILYETPKEKFDRTSKLREEYSKTPIVRDFDQVKVAYNQISGALKNPSAAGDLAAATKFMKLLDPGSVVRESELGMAMAATGVMDKASNYYNLLKTGQKLTPDQRKDFLNVAQTLYMASENVVIPLQTQFRNLAAEAGVNPNSVVVKVPSGAPAPQPEQSPGLPPGVRIRKVR